MNDIFECIDIDMTDEMLSNAKIAAYMSNQVIENPYGKMKPYNPKSFPDKAVVIKFDNNGIEYQIYLDTEEKAWNSFFITDGHVAKLSPEQLDRVLSTVNQSFDVSHLREFTVEAGRPDTITADKLYSIKEQ